MIRTLGGCKSMFAARHLQSGDAASFNIYFGLVRFPYFFDNFK